jgi:tol-pal system protein YbgF
MNGKKWLGAGLSIYLMMAQPVMAGLFDDDEARKAILDLREKQAQTQTGLAQRLDELDERTTKQNQTALDLNNQIAMLRSELAVQRGQNEVLQNQISAVQKNLKDAQIALKEAQNALEDRIKKFEPRTVVFDGKEGLVQPNEPNDFEGALKLFRDGQYRQAISAFNDFNRRYSESLYRAQSLYWLGNAYYAERDYKNTQSILQSMVEQFPNHAKSPEALLTVANGLAENGQKPQARKILDQILDKYPQSSAAKEAKERKLALK